MTTTYVASSDSDGGPIGCHGRKGDDDDDDDDDDDGGGGTVCGRASASTGASAAAGAGEDPDWVKAFSPPKSAAEPRRAARRATRGRPSGHAGTRGGGGESSASSDSILDLLDDGGGEMERGGKEERDAHEGSGERTVERANGDEAVSGARGKDARAGTNVGAKSRSVNSCLPLVAAAKLDDSLVLVQAESVDLDVSGDVGSVGRVKVDADGVSLDIKGTLYSCDVQDTNTICVVTVGDDEARITAMFDQVLTLHDDKTAFGAGEQLLSGVLDEEVDDGGDAAEAAVKPKAKSIAARAKPRKANLRPKPKPKARPRPMPKQTSKKTTAK
jgi:hypothetical protein